MTCILKFGEVSCNCLFTLQPLPLLCVSPYFFKFFVLLNWPMSHPAQPPTGYPQTAAQQQPYSSNYPPPPHGYSSTPYQPHPGYYDQQYQPYPGYVTTQPHAAPPPTTYVHTVEEEKGGSSFLAGLACCACLLCCCDFC
eukprot:m.134472 g.134472  ORF g.134472 m.134472 type:complete len:139 (+) comp15823_c0_seq1:374-790(+)